MTYSRMIGWALLFGGLAGAMNANSLGYGIGGTVLMLIVVCVGLWHAVLSGRERY